MSPVDLAKRLNKSIEIVVQHLFAGSAVKRGGRWNVGDIDGKPGESLVIYENSGRFKDFSTGKEGDILELISLRHGSKAEGIRVGHDILGIPMAIKRSATEKVIQWKPPVKDWTQLTENPAVVEYLTVERKIP